MIQYNTFQLNNGLNVIHHHDNSTQLCALNILYKVGSRNEDPTKTGFAHLFEHLMFGGSENIPEFDLAGVSIEEKHIEHITPTVPTPAEQLFDLPNDEEEGMHLSAHEDQSELPPLDDIEPRVEEELPSVEEERPIAIEPIIQAEIPLEPLVVSTPLALNALISISHGKHEKIDKFNGNYSLKEKITFINELFNGSSESFASAVKQIDSHASMDTLMPTLNYLSATHTWTNANQEALGKFIEKVVAKYA